MANVTQEILKTLLDEIKGIARTETILGEPFKLEDIMIIPVSKINIGFGAGGGGATSKDSESGQGGGAGGGVTIEPVAFIVVQSEDVKILPIKSKAFGSLIEGIPDLVSKITEMKKTKKGEELDD